jgi:two-component system response regulator ArlR
MPKKVKKILVIEDEIALAKALRIKLERRGFVIDVAKNGVEGLDLIEKNTYTGILLDLIMPEMNGFDVLTVLQEKGVVVPVVILSNLSQEEDRQKTKELGAVHFFVKSNTPITDIVGFVEKNWG